MVLLLAVAVVAFASLGGDDSSSTSNDAADRADTGEAERPRKRAQAPEAASAPEPSPAEETEPAPEEPVTDGSAVDPEEGARLDAQAFGLIQQGKYAEAVPIARQAVASFPEDDQTSNYAFALFNLGTALNRSGSPDEAIPFLEKRLSFSDDRPEVVQAELDDARANAGG